MTTSNIAVRQNRYVVWLIQLAIIIILFMYACGEGYHGDSTNKSERGGSAALNIQWYDAPTALNSNLTAKAAVLDCQAGGVDYVVCEVYDETGEHLATGGPWPCSAGSGEIDYIPVGSARTFVALAEDTDGNILYHGQTFDITIRANEYTDNIFIDAFPFIPTLTFPAEGAQVDPNGFTFSWQSLANADQYIIQVAEDSTFENIVLDDTASSAAYVPGTLLPSMEYFWRIFAVDLFTNLGAESEIRSFITSDCTYAISSEANTFGPEGGSGDFNVEPSSGDCSWTAVASDDWITLTADVSGSGDGYIGYSIAANTSSSDRTGTIMVGGQVHTITQEGLDCTFAISPASDSFTAQGGSSTIQVTSTADDCPWDAVSSAGWITIASGGSGSGNGTVGYRVAANPTTGQRRGMITIEGQTHTVIQEGGVCTYSITPAANTFTADGGTGRIQVRAGDGCTWIAASNVAWVTISSDTSGSGTGAVVYQVAANATAAQRRGIITVGGQTHTITQAGVGCTYQIAPAARSFTFDAGTGTIQVTSQDGCTWNAVSNVAWVTLTSGANGNGSGTVTYRVAANGTTTQRRGIITVGGQTHTITQAAVACEYQIAPAARTFTSDAGNGTIQVTSQDGCTWNAASNVAWVTITSGASGSGGGTVAYRVAANGTTVQRRGIITVGGQTHTITQAAVECSYQIAPVSRTFSADAGTGTIQVTSQDGCDWDATSQVAWITITSGGSGSGSGTVGYQVEENTVAETRTGVIFIERQQHTVTQAGADVATCSATTLAGNDEPHSQYVEMGQTSGTFQFTYNHAGIPDRTIVSYEGTVLLDTTCRATTGGDVTQTLSYQGSSTQIFVQVEPNCNDTTGTYWRYTVGCPE